MEEAADYLPPPHGTRERRWPPRDPPPLCPDCGAPVDDAYLHADHASIVVLPCGQRLVMEGLSADA